MLSIFGSITYIYYFIIALVLFFFQDITNGVYFHLSIIVYSLIFLPFYSFLDSSKNTYTLFFLVAIAGVLLTLTNGAFLSIAYLIYCLYFIFFKIDFFRTLGLGIIFLIFSFVLNFSGANIDPSINTMGFVFISLAIAQYIYETFFSKAIFLKKLETINLFNYFYFIGFLLVIFELYYNTSYNIQIFFTLFLIFFNLFKNKSGSSSNSNLLSIGNVLTKQNIIKTSILYFGLFLLIFIPFVKNAGMANQNHYSYILLGFISLLYIALLGYNYLNIKSEIGKSYIKTGCYLGATLLILGTYYFISSSLFLKQEEKKEIEEIPFEFNVVDETGVEENTKEIEDFLEEVDLSE